MRRFIPIWLALGFALAARLAADPVTPHEVKAAVEAWLAADACPLGADLRAQVGAVETGLNANGEAAYYLVHLEPSGLIIASGDDLVEPIIAFSPTGSFDPSPANPLAALVSGDLPARVGEARRMVEEAHRQGRPFVPHGRFLEARGKWDRLRGNAVHSGQLSPSPQPSPAGGEGADVSSVEEGLISVSDPRVDPLIASRWSQTTVCSSAVYNYYTPPYSAGSTSNYPCGCVATAMAQLMRFYQHPTAGVGPGRCYTIYVCGSPQSRCLRGGDGSGGAYDWANMSLVPDCSTTLVQRQAIGALCHDAGVSVNMDYCSAGSGADTLQAADAYESIFGYTNAVKGYNAGTNIPTSALNTMANPNLDAGYPVLLGISGSVGGHAVVCDGYGYTSGTLYHHLNMGWSGAEDEWYNLPNIDSSPSFSIVYKCVYNVYVTGSGEIISGRVTDQAGGPIEGATVTAERAGGGTYETTTNARGIYALAKVPSNSQYAVAVSSPGCEFLPQSVSTGTSSDYYPTSGNVWQVDFMRADRTPAVARDVTICTRQDVPVTITLSAADDGLPDPPGMLTYLVMTLPEHGTLSDPNAGQIVAVPCALASYGNRVIYAPAPAYMGIDDFQFKVNDGGTPPYDGDSNIASVSISVLPSCPAPPVASGPTPGLGASDVAVNTRLSWANSAAYAVLESTGSTCDTFAVSRINGLPGLGASMLTWSTVASTTGALLKANYDIIYFPVSASASDYDNLCAGVATGGALEQFASQGGTLVLNVAGNEGSRSDIAPGGLDYDRSTRHDAETFPSPDHRYITGSSFGGTMLDTSMFADWQRTDHGTLHNASDGSVSILANADGVSMLEHRYGAGRVIASTLTFGWVGAGDEHSAQPWDNQLLYAAASTADCPVTYDVYLGTSPQTMTLIAADLTVPACDPGTLQIGTTYFWKVLAKSAGGTSEGEVWSFTTECGSPEPIPTAKCRPDGEVAYCGPGVVTDVGTNVFYFETEDRTCGLRVVAANHGVQIGQMVCAAGAMFTNSDGERCIDAFRIDQTGFGSVEPLGMNNRAVGGADWNYESSTGAGQRGVVLPDGLNNVGLLVKTWGKVTSVDPGSSSFVIWDGSNIVVGTWPDVEGYPVDVLVVVPGGSDLPQVGEHLIVTGISSCAPGEGGLRRVVRAGLD